jgi:two-component system, NtrC family, sensor kinase
MKSLRNKLLLLILPLCLVPLVGISGLSYFLAKERITHDRIVLYLEQIAQDIAVTIQLTLLEKREEILSMTLFSEFREYLLNRNSRSPQPLLNELVKIHDVYDILALFDIEGNLVITSSINRNTILGRSLDERQLRSLVGHKLQPYTPDTGWLRAVRSGQTGYIDWHRSPLVHQLYDYQDQDVQRHYSIGFAAPIVDERGVVIGGILALLNWESFQEILDKVEEDLEHRSLTSGYAMLLGRDRNTIIAHKFRRNRSYREITPNELLLAVDNYGARLREDQQLVDLQEAVEEGRRHFSYESPPGSRRITGLAPVNDSFFQWVCGIGIDSEDIFAPVQQLKEVLIIVASLSAFLVVILTYSIARQISIPLKRLTQGASVIAAGDFSQRVRVSSRDEIGELAETFNEMARSLEERSHALIELNRRLEEKVKERTGELEKKSREANRAYEELKETQVQLVQSEKLAGLGQLVAGIAHEIKNPLNFIYGNTEFLKTYVANLKKLIDLYHCRAALLPQDNEKIAALKEEMNYDFMLEDMETLLRNFEEGAVRINSIIADLRTFSRMDSEDFQPTQLRDSIELALNLVKNEYRDRIVIRKEYADLPLVHCHPGKLSQVFMNLLVNACQAIPGTGEISIRTYCNGDRVFVEIKDNGAGIEAKHQVKVFEPFFTTKPVGKGTGLGLSISYGIIQQHQGTIELESKKGEGTLFRICLPVKP